MPFADYEMPVHYAPGVLKERLHERATAELFDVSCMGKTIVRAAEKDADRLAACMITYLSTNGVFAETVFEPREITHDNGSTINLDGTDLDALVGLARPPSGLTEASYWPRAESHLKDATEGPAS